MIDLLHATLINPLILKSSNLVKKKSKRVYTHVVGGWKNETIYSVGMLR